MDTVALWEEEIEYNAIKEQELEEAAIYNFFGDITEEFVFYDFFDSTIISEDVQMLREGKEPSKKEQDLFNKILKSAKIKPKDAEKGLKQIKAILGIDLMEVCVKISTYSVKVITEEGLTKTSKEKINNYMHKTFEEFAGLIRKEGINKDWEEFSDNKAYQDYVNNKKLFNPNNLKSAFDLSLRVYMANTIIDQILTRLFGITGSLLSAVVVCPIIEESAKIAAVKGDFVTEFTLLFNVFEFNLYIRGYGATKRVIQTRLIVVGMHLTTTLIHYLGQHSEIINKITPKDLEKITGKSKQGQKEKPKNIIISSFLGILIHMFWNAGMGNAIVSAILK